MFLTKRIFLFDWFANGIFCIFLFKLHNITESFLLTPSHSLHSLAQTQTSHDARTDNLGCFLLSSFHWYHWNHKQVTRQTKIARCKMEYAKKINFHFTWSEIFSMRRQDAQEVWFKLAITNWCVMLKII